LIEVNFYKTQRWKNKREKVLRRDEYLCQECKRYERTTEANTVHHIRPLMVSPELRLDSSNLVSLCNTCHERMHDRKTHGLSELGEQWVKRMEMIRGYGTNRSL
jgi:5-methylcytosine-specific restriction endonuclease McrA